MKLLTRLALISFVTAILINVSYSQQVTRSDGYHDLDPRLPEWKTDLLFRLQVASGYYQSAGFGIIDSSKISGFNRQIYVQIKHTPPGKLNFNLDDFKFSAGLKIKEDWLGAVESDSGISNLQSIIMLTGKAVIKDKIEIYHDITLFRSDTTSYLDSASTTGEFLKNPLLNYQLAHRGPVASDIDVLEMQTDRALIKTDIWGIGVQTGRDRIQFKGGYRSGLLFSGLTRPVDMFYRLDYDIWRFGFTALSGQLTDDGKKYISAKKVTFRAADCLKLEATEAVVFADDPAAYINPLMLFYITHRHRPTNNDNLIASVGFSFTPYKNLNFYGEFLDDDLIIFEGGASKYGFLFGIFKSGLFSERIDLRAEYSHVRKWTYTHVSRINTWEYRGQAFGFWLGPDADELYAQLKYFFSPSTIADIAFDYVRKGEGSIFLPHEAEGGDKNPVFPSGIVEKSAGFWVDFEHHYNNLSLNGRFGFRSIKNRHNLPGDTNNYFSHIVVVYKIF